MAIQSFEVLEIKCIDDGDGDQGVRFIGKNIIVTLVLDRGRQEHDKEICELQRTLWNAGRRPFTMFIQNL
jgi:hypothetical protein